MKADFELEIQAKIKLTTNYDMDRQYMAALDLSELLQKYHQKITQPLLVRIIDSLLRLLEDQMDQLHDCGIKCLIKIIQIIPIEQCKRISETMIYKVKNPATREQLRNVYGNGIKTIISNVPFQLGGHLKDLLKLTIDALLQNTTVQLKIQQQLIDILSSFIRKWPKVVGKIEFNRTGLAKYLINNIQKQGVPVIHKKRSYLCIGQYAAAMNQNEFKFILLGNEGFINYITSQNKLQEKKQAFHTLNAILKSKNRYLQEFAKVFFDILETQIHSLKNQQGLEDDDQKAVLIYQIFESVLNSLNLLILSFYKQVKQKLSKKIIKQIIQLITYSPQYNIQYLVDMQVEQEDNQQEMQVQQIVDLSNKVRRQNLILISTLSKIHSKLCDQFSRVDDLYNTLKEKDNEVREASFILFTNLFEGITIQQNLGLQGQSLEQPKFMRVMSSFKEQAPEILERTVKKISELNKNKNIDQSTKINSSKLLLHISKSFPSIIVTNEKLLMLMLDVVLDLIFKNVLIEIQINLLNSLQRIFLKTFHYENYSRFFPLILKFINTKQQKLLTSTFRFITSYLQNFASTIKKSSDDFNKLIDFIISKFKNSYTLQTRLAISTSVNEIFKGYNHIVDPIKYQQLLRIILNKLQTDPQKRYLLLITTKLNINLPLNKSLVQQLNKLFLYIGESYLNNQDNFIKDYANLSMLKIIIILRNNLNKANSVKILAKGQILFSNNEFPQFYLQLSELYSDLFKPWISHLLQINNLPISIIKKLINDKVTKPQECLTILKQSLKKQNIQNSIKILKELQYSQKVFQKQVADSLWGRVAIGVLGQYGNIKYVDILKQYSLGNYSQQTKLIASIALGGVISKNFKIVVTNLLQQIKKIEEEQKYNIFLALKEGIIRSDSFNYLHIVQAINFIINDILQSKNQKQSILNIIAECIAKIIVLSPLGSKEFVKNLHNSPIQNLRYIFATTFGYVFKLPVDTIQEEVVDQYVKLLVHMLEDTSFQIKSGALKSLSVILFNNPSILIPRIDESFFYLVQKCCIFDKSFLVVLDYGIKITVDKGKSMRIQAFSLLQTSLVKQTYKILQILNIFPQLITTCLFKIEEDPSDDVLIHRLTLLELVTKKHPESIISLDKEFTQKLNSETGKLKQFKAKRLNEDNSIQRVLKNILRLINDIYNNTKQQFSTEMDTFYNDLKKIPRFKEILDSILKQQD